MNNNFIYRLYHVCMVVLQLRGRFIIAWIISEIICCISGVGFDPCIHPYSIDIKIFRTVDIKKVELSTSMRYMIQGWNCSVQSWMAIYIYKRLTFESKLLRQVITMSLSAFWHGLHPGYYVSFIQAPFFQLIQQSLWDNLDNYIYNGIYSNIYNYILYIIQWFISQLLVFYLTIPFCYQTLENTWKVWKSLYFCGHILILIIAILSIITQKKIKNKN
eukprot:GHVL01017050.1.p1 GENE.GHVL01017050.1~~GHVL01017050.1.p1  ORF type:complete len:217 (+),score=39.36 GHVL01017050.1:381-1031(+)